MKDGIDHPVIVARQKLRLQPVGLRHRAFVERITPFAAMDRLIHTKLQKNAGIREVREPRPAQLELHDERRMLDETLIIFSPGSGKLARSINRRHADRVPAATEASGTRAG